MPEGHSIHRLAVAHRALLAGRPVEVSSPQGRFADGAAQVTGRVLEDTSAYGKHLFHHYAGDRIVHVHLGLYGKFATGPLPVPEPVGLIRMRLAGERGWLELRGPTACEVLDPHGVALIHQRLGPDPLRDDSDPAPAYARIARSNAPLLQLIMDQSVLAGPGLIYATEVLFRAGLSPATPGRALSETAFTSIWEDLRALMKEGVAQGRIDTVHVRHTPEAMRRAPRVDRHGGEVYVYRRAGLPCLVCGTPVASGTMAGRNSYWCPLCQRAPRARRTRRGA